MPRTAETDQGHTPSLLAGAQLPDHITCGDAARDLPAVRSIPNVGRPNPAGITSPMRNVNGRNHWVIVRENSEANSRGRCRVHKGLPLEVATDVRS